MLNKKILLIAAIISFGVTSAYAQSPTNKMYAGIDWQYNQLEAYSDIKNIRVNNSKFDLIEDLSGVSLFGGYRWDRMGAELGITAFTGYKYTSTVIYGPDLFSASITQKNLNTYLDGIYYHPLTSKMVLIIVQGLA